MVELHGRDAAQIDAFLRGDGQGGAHLCDALHHLHSQHDGVLLVEDAGGQDLEGAGEHRGEAGGLLLSKPLLLHIRRELVKQVVDDVCCEDLDVELLGQLTRLLVDRHIKRQDHCVLLGALLVHHVGPQHVLLVHRPDVDAGHRDVDLVTAQEGEQSLQGAKGGGLHAHALSALVHFTEDVGHVRHRRVLELLLVVLRPHHEHRGTRHRSLQAGSHNPHTHGGAYLLVVHQGALHTHLTQHLRCFECLDSCDNRPS
mmetsp:Transcript_33806/g.74949  ORF Transcript_33806/g.74949 Transcript_33806/m.74949 type:complete len:256 (-) Transcript_33806:1701-2468(-)